MMNFKHLPHPPECFYKSNSTALTPNDDVFATIKPNFDHIPENVQKLKAALEYVSADCDRNTWRNVIFAIHSLGWNDAGKSIARDWSLTAPDLFDERDFKRDWTSAKADKSGGITISTLFKLATDGGWIDSKYLFSKPKPISEIEWLSSKPHADCIVTGLIYADIALLIAPGGVGKTTLLLYMMVHIVLGKSIWGREIQRTRKVLYVTAEDSREILIARLRQICLDLSLSQIEVNTVKQDILISDVSGESFKLTSVVGDVVVSSAKVDEIINPFEKNELALVAFDPVVSFGVGESRVNDAEQGLVNAGRMIRNKLNCCVLFVHHTGKANAREGTIDQYSGRGGSAFADGSRMAFVMQNVDALEWKKQTGLDLPSDARGLILNPAKVTPMPLQDPFYLQRKGYTFQRIERVVKDASDLVSEHADKVWEALNEQLLNDRQHSKKSFEAIKDDYGLTLKECRAAFDTLQAQGRIEERGRARGKGKGGAYKYLHPVDLKSVFGSLETRNEAIENDEL